MKYLFHNESAFNKIKLFASDTWMCLMHGEGEEEIANHGWSRVKSFSQETGATGQQSHGVTILSRSYTLKSQVQDAHDSPTQLPFFFLPLFKSLKYRFKGPSNRGLFQTEHCSLRHRLLNKDVQVIILALIFVFCFCARADFVPNSESSQQPIAGERPFERGHVNRSGFKTMPSRFMKSAPQKSPDEKLHDVSDMYEKHFLREMMKAMRSTVHESGFIQQNQAEKIFREQLDDHYVDRWSEKGGIGLSKMIYEQLVQKFGVQLGIKNAIVKPQGPLPIDEKSNFTAHPFRHPGKKQSLSYRIDKKQLPDANGERNVQVKAPWNGVVVAEKKLPDQQTLLEIEHDNGLKSQVAFKGEVSKVSTGAKVQGGDTLGVLSTESKSLYWVVEPSKIPGPETVSE